MSVQLLIPAYFDPDDYSSLWTQMINAAAKGQSMTVIANPDSGPGSAQQSSYTSVIAKLKAAGAKVIGYVPTGYMKKTVSSIEKVIDNWYKFYPSIDGIFLDEMSNTNNSTYVANYKTLTVYIKAKNSTTEQVVIGNPGTNTLEMYVGSVDTMVIYEDTAANFSNYTLDSWVRNFDSSNFAMLFYGTTEAEMKSILPTVLADNISYVFFESNSLDDAYTTLGSYFDDEVGEI